MSVTKKRPRMKRTQISLPADQLDAARRVAARRRTSMSGLVRSALERELDEEEAIQEKMLSIVGILKGADPDGSEKHDEVLYQ